MNARNLALFAALTVAAQVCGANAAGASTIKSDREMTKLAAMLLRNVDDAKSALSTENMSGARADIDDALTAQKDMSEMAHTYGSSMIVPLYSEFDDRASLARALRNRKASTALDVRGNTVDATYVAIDLDKAKMRLDRADAAVKANRVQQAQQALTAVGSDLIVASVSGDDPLLTAREDLALANRAESAGRPTLAAADVKQAAKALQRFTSAPHAADARHLAGEMSSADSQSSARESATAKIDAWWNSVTGWFATHA